MDAQPKGSVRTSVCSSVYPSVCPSVHTAQKSGEPLIGFFCFIKAMDLLLDLVLGKENLLTRKEMMKATVMKTFWTIQVMKWVKMKNWRELKMMLLMKKLTSRKLCGMSQVTVEFFICLFFSFSSWLVCFCPFVWMPVFMSVHQYVCP